jgi:hypothetical protein
MNSRNRARTRAVRNLMAKTGENYTRAARSGRGTPTDPAAIPQTDLVKEHVRRVLEANRRADEATLERAEELERNGRRIIDGGQTSEFDWDITDWRTGELIAKGATASTGTTERPTGSTPTKPGSTQTISTARSHSLT